MKDKQVVSEIRKKNGMVVVVAIAATGHIGKGASKTLTSGAEQLAKLVDGWLAESLADEVEEVKAPVKPVAVKPAAKTVAKPAAKSSSKPVAKAASKPVATKKKSETAASKTPARRVRPDYETG